MMHVRVPRELARRRSVAALQRAHERALAAREHLKTTIAIRSWLAFIMVFPFVCVASTPVVPIKVIDDERPSWLADDGQDMRDYD